MSVTLTVHGIPAPQGSKTRTKWGMREDNPNTKPWRAAVAAEAAAATIGKEPLTGPLALAALFFFPRPKSHYGTGRNADVLKATAPDYCATKPDADKLLRAAADAMTGIVYRDDSQLVHVSARKLYGQPRAVLVISEAA
jgi:Holliday junction resolvase RusA-like endonuclease